MATVIQSYCLSDVSLFYTLFFSSIYNVKSTSGMYRSHQLYRLRYTAEHSSTCQSELRIPVQTRIVYHKRSYRQYAWQCVRASAFLIGPRPKPPGHRYHRELESRPDESCTSRSYQKVIWSPRFPTVKITMAFLVCVVIHHVTSSFCRMRSSGMLG